MYWPHENFEFKMTEFESTMYNYLWKDEMIHVMESNVDPKKFLQHSSVFNTLYDMILSKLDNEDDRKKFYNSVCNELFDDKVSWCDTCDKICYIENDDDYMMSENEYGEDICLCCSCYEKHNCDK